MRTLAAFSAAALALALTAGAAALTRDHPARVARVAQPAACGIERWPEKTVSDPLASKVRLTPHDSTVASLRLLPKVGRASCRERVWTVV